jgi:hypothetical protein
MNFKEVVNGVNNQCITRILLFNKFHYMTRNLVHYFFVNGERIIGHISSYNAVISKSYVGDGRNI